MNFVFSNYEEAIEKFYGSLRKRFKLEYKQSFNEIDKQLDDLFLNVVVISDDDNYSNELISDINAGEEYFAYGVYRSGEVAYEKVESAYEMVENFLKYGENKFVFVSFDKKKKFDADIDNCIIVRFYNDNGSLVVDIDKKLKKDDSEVIRRVKLDDYDECLDILNRLYLGRYEKRKDVFMKTVSITRNEFLGLCGRFGRKSAFVCIRDGKIVGFISYEVIVTNKKRHFNERVFIRISDIFVMSSYRRMGIGTRLFQVVAKFAKRLNAPTVEFLSWDFDEDIKKFIFSLQSKPLNTYYEITI